MTGGHVSVHAAHVGAGVRRSFPAFSITDNVSKLLLAEDTLLKRAYSCIL